MKILITLVCFLGLLAFAGTAIAASFIHPLDFTGTQSERDQVISYIKQDVKETYTAIGMDDPLTLRMMENENLKRFKQLTRVTNRALLDRVIETYCGIGMCNYNTISMMYNEQLKASSQSLTW